MGRGVNTLFYQSKDKVYFSFPSQEACLWTDLDVMNEYNAADSEYIHNEMICCIATSETCI